MATDYGSAGRVLTLLGLTTDDMTIADVELYINEAIRDIQAETYEQSMLDTVFATVVNDTGVVNRVYNTYFAIKADSQADLKVYVRGVLLTQDTNYTYDLSTSTITISSSYELNSMDTISIYYVPAFYDDYANLLASLFITETKLVNLPSSNSGATITERIDKRLDKYRKMIRQKPRMSRFRDHAEDGGVW